MQNRKSLSFPTFQQTLSAVDPLSNLVYGAMETAALKTAGFFKAEKQPHDPFLAPCLMRFFGKHTLRGSGIGAEEDGEVSDFEGLPNNGLAFFYRHHHVRILKAATVRGAPWKLPGCGDSEPKTNFYNQQLEFYQDGRGGMQSSVLNIVYLWDFDRYLKVSDIYMACPMAAGAYAKDVTEHWSGPIPHPAFSRGAEKPPSSDRQSEEVLEELLRDPKEEDEAIEKA